MAHAFWGAKVDLDPLCAIIAQRNVGEERSQCCVEVTPFSARGLSLFQLFTEQCGARHAALPNNAMVFRDQESIEWAHSLE
jgi:hypothetical protein